MARIQCQKLLNNFFLVYKKLFLKYLIHSLKNKKSFEIISVKILHQISRFVLVYCK